MKKVLFILEIFLTISLLSPNCFAQLDRLNKKQCRVTVQLGEIVSTDISLKTVEYIEKTLTSEFNKVWVKIDTDGQQILPKCVYDSLQKLTKDFPIIINWENLLNDYTSGDKASDLMGQYKGGQIYIYSVYRRLFKAILDTGIEKDYCLKGLLFHELLHMALLKYSNENGSDEALVEDCELKLFPCGPDLYKYAQGRRILTF